MSQQPSECADAEYHGKPFRYCPCGWIEPPAPPRYEVAIASDGSLPVILDSSTKQSVLALDDRLVDGRRHLTPVFASQEIAAIVLRALNAS